MLNLELVKDKKANNLINAVEKSKSQGLSRLLFGLGIRHVGQKAAGVLAEHFGSMDKLMAVKKEDLESIYEIGVVIADSIVSYFSLDSTRALVKCLKQVGVKMEENIKNIAKDPDVSGKKFIFTGQLQKYSRTQAQAFVKNLGGNVLSSVSKRLDFVVIGDSAGSKLDKARELGLNIINEEEFLKLVKK